MTSRWGSRLGLRLIDVVKPQIRAQFERAQAQAKFGCPFMNLSDGCAHFETELGQRDLDRFVRRNRPRRLEHLVGKQRTARFVEFDPSILEFDE